MKRLEIDNKKCIRCGACVKICAIEHFKTKNELFSAIKIIDIVNNFPKIDICDQCGDCEKACTTGAISRNELGAYIIDSAKCVGCLECINACKKNGMNYVQKGVMPFTCDLCGKCVPSCPTLAIKLVDIDEE